MPGIGAGISYSPSGEAVMNVETTWDGWSSLRAEGASLTCRGPVRRELGRRPWRDEQGVAPSSAYVGRKLSAKTTQIAYNRSRYEMLKNRCSRMASVNVVGGILC